MDEFELVDLLTRRLPPPAPRVRIGPGDDAAVVEEGGIATVTTIDALIEGVHFTLPEFPPAAVGHKALAAALSDLAAMGAEPGEAYVALGLPERFDEGFALELHRGIRELAATHHVELLGGDISRAPVLILAVTAVGREPAGGALVPRSGASPGELVAVTGELGGAAAGLRLLAQGSDGSERAESLKARQLAPQPRLAAGIALGAAGAKAMIDISDGLGADARHLADASGVRLELELGRLPVQPGVAEVAGGEEAALELAASGGEDYELLVCLPPASLEVASAALGAGSLKLTEIGAVSEGSGVSIRTPEGGELEPRGFDHLA